MSTYASFQGRVFLGKRDVAGLLIEVRSPGNVADLKLSLKTDVLEHYESQTGQRSLDHRMVKQKSATVNLTIEEFTKENLALALYGNHVTGSTGSVTDEPVGGAAPVVGDRYFLAHPKVSALVVVDSAGENLSGLRAGLHPAVQARLAANLPSQAGREDWVAVRLVHEADGLAAEPVYGKSNLIFTLARAAGLVRIPPDATGLSAGELVEVILL